MKGRLGLGLERFRVKGRVRGAWSSREGDRGLDRRMKGVDVFFGFGIGGFLYFEVIIFYRSVSFFFVVWVRGDFCI